MRLWSVDSIREALDIKEREGRCVVTLTSPDEARLFRLAVYNYCRKHALNSISMSLSGCDVILGPKLKTSSPLSITSENEAKSESSP